MQHEKRVFEYNTIARRMGMVTYQELTRLIDTYHHSNMVWGIV